MAQTSGELGSRCSNGTLGSNSSWTALCEEMVPCGDGLGPESPADLVWQKRLVKMSHLCLQTAAVPRAQTSACPLSSILTQDLDLLSTSQRCKQVQPIERRGWNSGKWRESRFWDFRLYSGTDGGRGESKEVVIVKLFVKRLVASL